MDLGTLRKGSHSTADQTCTWQTDAECRDLTFNALVNALVGLGPTGEIKLFDWTGAADDILNRKVQFVGDALARLDECPGGPPRILRCFRQAAQLGFEVAEESIAAVVARLQLVEQISAETMWKEMGKLLTANHSMAVLLQMAQIGIARLVKLPQEMDLNELVRVQQVTRHKLKADQILLLPAVLCLVALLRDSTELEYLSGSWALSVKEIRLAESLLQHKTSGTTLTLAHARNILTGQVGAGGNARGFWEEIDKARMLLVHQLWYQGNLTDAQVVADMEIPEFPV